MRHDLLLKCNQRPKFLSLNNACELFCYEAKGVNRTVKYKVLDFRHRVEGPDFEYLHLDPAFGKNIVTNP